MSTHYPNQLGLYLHIPFCQRKCLYCDFYSLTPDDPKLVSRYVDALIAHMKEYKNAASGHIVNTVYIGGGTPTFLQTEQLLAIVRAVKKNFRLSPRAEFTIEANPATVSPDMLRRLRRAGVNRISFGMQSAMDNELKALGRLHTRAEFEKSFRMARAAGFDNINIDVMFGIPEQDISTFGKTVRYAVSLEPEHISMYGLKIEEGTPFAAMKNRLPLPNEDEEYDMYLAAIEFLASRGYEHYEISNFALRRRRCRHNCKYWNCDEYLGLGAAAHSYFNGMRFSFAANIETYIEVLEGRSKKSIITVQNEILSPRERLGEYVMLRLRMRDGINTQEFRRRFGFSFEEMFLRKLQRYIDLGFAVTNGKNYALTPKGMYISNYILSDLLDF